MRLLLAFVLVTQAMLAQTERPQLYGEVIDSSGATVVHAKLKLYECGRTQPLRSEFSFMGGGFSFLLARPAKSCYNISVTAPGFKMQTMRDIDPAHIDAPYRHLKITMEEDGSPPIPSEIPREQGPPLEAPIAFRDSGEGEAPARYSAWGRAGQLRCNDLAQIIRSVRKAVRGTRREPSLYSTDLLSGRAVHLV